MGLSFSHLIVLLIIVLIFFGAGKLPRVMGDFGKGVRAFKAGLDGKELPPEQKDNKQKAIADENEDSGTPMV